ncbi:MAG: hypothetical protein LC637_12950 [Xanthomonadaceae bacterium]|nr:hypothetical protein [Xanthomonadaceae bacterium]
MKLIMRFRENNYIFMIRILIALLSLTVAGGCAFSSSMSHLDYMLKENGDRVTYLRTGRILGVHFVTVRSVGQGQIPVNPENAVDIDFLDDDDLSVVEPILFSISAHPSLLESLRLFQEPLNYQLMQSRKLIKARGLLKPLEKPIRIHVRFVPKNSDFDFQKTDFYVNAPVLDFAASVDLRSAQRFEYSLISTLDTIHHELIHFLVQKGWLAVPGADYLLIFMGIVRVYDTRNNKARLSLTTLRCAQVLLMQT